MSETTKECGVGIGGGMDDGDGEREGVRGWCSV